MFPELSSESAPIPGLVNSPLNITFLGVGIADLRTASSGFGELDRGDLGCMSIPSFCASTKCPRSAEKRAQRLAKFVGMPGTIIFIV